MPIKGTAVRIAHWSMAIHDIHGYNIYFHPKGPIKLLISHDDKEKYLEACAAYIVSLFKAGVDGISLEGLPVERLTHDLMDSFCKYLSHIAEQEEMALDIDAFKLISSQQKWVYGQSTSFLYRKNFCQATLVVDDLLNGYGRVYELNISEESVSLILAEVENFRLMAFLEAMKSRMDSAHTLMMGSIDASFYPDDLNACYEKLKTFKGLCNPVDRSENFQDRADDFFSMVLASFPAKFLTATDAKNYATLENQIPTNRLNIFFPPQDRNHQTTDMLINSR